MPAVSSGILAITSEDLPNLNIGGKFVPETLMPAMAELEESYEKFSKRYKVQGITIDVDPISML